MSNNIENNFKRVVEQIFNNWTALQLAVENETAGATSRQTAIETMDWICNYCISQNDLSVSDITEALEDIMDEEFNTICEDDSPKEIAHLLLKFLHNIKQGNIEQFELDFNNLPTCKIWLSHEVPSTKEKTSNIVEEDSGTSSTEHQMDVDPEWTVVSRKKK